MGKTISTIGNIKPWITNTDDIGTSLLKYKKIYATSGDFTNLVAPNIIATNGIATQIYFGIPVYMKLHTANFTFRFITGEESIGTTLVVAEDLSIDAADIVYIRVTERWEALDGSYRYRLDGCNSSDDTSFRIHYWSSGTKTNIYAYFDSHESAELINGHYGHYIVCYTNI
jgi:hypothetical protein